MHVHQLILFLFAYAFLVISFLSFSYAVELESKIEKEQIDDKKRSKMYNYIILLMVLDVVSAFISLILITMLVSQSL